MHQPVIYPIYHTLINHYYNTTWLCSFISNTFNEEDNKDTSDNTSLPQQAAQNPSPADGSDGAKVQLSAQPATEMTNADAVDEEPLPTNETEPEEPTPTLSEQEEGENARIYISTSQTVGASRLYGG